MLNGDSLLTLWPYLMLATGFALLASGVFKARRIQPGRFRWSTFRNEAAFAAINLVVTGFTLAPINAFLRNHSYIVLDQSHASWWIISLEFALYFLLFDTWFYWLHRWMHKEPFYRWIHKLHHRSTSPNPLTTFSVSPLESIVNGGFLPVFLTIGTLLGGLHQESVAIMVPANIAMGVYVHLGHEFLPRWWNKTWVTKWFITTTFHDQHHKYFKYNFGGYTAIWDYLMGTVRKQYEADFEDIGRNRVKADLPARASASADRSTEVPA